MGGELHEVSSEYDDPGHRWWQWNRYRRAHQWDDSDLSIVQANTRRRKAATESGPKRGHEGDSCRPGCTGRPCQFGEPRQKPFTPTTGWNLPRRNHGLGASGWQ